MQTGRRERERVAACARLITFKVAILVFDYLLVRSGLVRLVAICDPAFLTVKIRHTEAASPFDSIRIKLRETVLDINSFLSRMATDLVENASESLLTQADLELLSLDL